MLLRRITQHVKNQNWFAFFLDFIIVVVGVFIGIQVANWNEARQQRATAGNYVERIREDLLANQEDGEQRLNYFNKTREHALAALEALEREQESLDVQFLIDVYQASQILPREVGRDAYNEVISVGANNAISDLNIRKRLANHYRGTKSQVDNFNHITNYRELIRSNMPYAVQAAIRAACDDIVTSGEHGEPIAVLPENCYPEISPEVTNKGIETVIALDIRTPLIRRLSDLDLKISQAKIFIKRAHLMEQFLANLPD